MNTYNLLKLSLTFHLLGIAVTFGSVFLQFIVYRKFWKEYFASGRSSLMMLNALAPFPAVAGIGMLLLLLSGIAMMLLTNGVYMNTLWFKLKLGVIVLLIINGLVFLRKEIIRTRVLVNDGSNNVALAAQQKRMYVVFALQLLLFVSIFILASFRFA